jgi:glycosyltransferase involved in cell wall biosynthesis
MYAYHPPLTVGVTAILIRFFRRTPLVYDIQDLWPDTLAATDMIKNTTALRLIEGLCGWVYRHSDFITVLSPGFKRRLIEQGVTANKLSIIYNWADEASLTASSARLPTEFPGQDYFRILFAGNMGKAQALEVVLEAALLLKDQCPHICFILVGDGVEKNRLMDKAKEIALSNVLFLPRVSMNEIGGYLSAADALLVNLSNDPLFEITIPSKTQAYMAAGKPILMAVSGDAADLLRFANAGVAVPPGSASLLSEAVKYLADLSPRELKALGQNASTFYNANMSLRIGVQSFKRIFNEAIENHQ